MNNSNFPYRRLLIVGCGGAGKSTLARMLGQKLSLPIVHLDKLWWLPEWKTRDESDFDALLTAELKKPSWIIEGNFVRTFDLRLKYADFCIFLDYPRDLCIKSVYERAEKYRGTTRPDITEGCVEYVDAEFEKWIRSFDKEVKPAMTVTLKNSGVDYFISASREKTEEWLDSIER